MNDAPPQKDSCRTPPKTVKNGGGGGATSASGVTPPISHLKCILGEGTNLGWVCFFQTHPNSLMKNISGGIRGFENPGLYSLCCSPVFDTFGVLGGRLSCLTPLVWWLDGFPVFVLLLSHSKCDCTFTFHNESPSSSSSRSTRHL